MSAEGAGCNAGEGGGAHVLSLAIEKALLEMSVLCTKKAQTAESNSVSTLDWSNLVVKPRTGHTSESAARGWSNYPSLRRGCRNLVGSVAPCSFSSWLGCLHDWELSFAVCLQILLGAFPGELVGTLL